ncbi:hypothetical protein MHJ97_12575, partial [Macrococcus epidermidis]|uniref:hypothetical protein n=1 Tax=Macrococcus epidermidis TaxID=1902580 RepID=UPI001EF386F6
ISGILSYLVNWSVKVFAPFYLSYSIVKKKYFTASLIIVIQVLMYLSFGNKAFLFSIGLVLIILYTISSRFIRNITLTLVGLNIFSVILYKYLKFDELFRAIPYRMIYIPAQLQFQYYDFFSIREKIKFADGLFGKLFGIESPYQHIAPLMISKHYYGSLYSANTGIFAEAFTNGGWIILIFFSVLLGILFLLIDITTYRLPLNLVIGSLSYILFVLNDTGLLTTLLTGGLLLMIILLVLLNSGWNKED